MPLIIVTPLSPTELLRTALDRARAASAAIQRLQHAPLAPAETLHDRLLTVATHAHALSEAFEIIETLAANYDEIAAAHAAVTAPVSPPAPREESPPDHRGVRREDDPNAN